MAVKGLHRDSPHMLMCDPGLEFGQFEGKASWPWLLKNIGGHHGQYAGHQGHWYFKQNIKLMQYTQALYIQRMLPYRGLCIPVHYTKLRQVKSYNHILFAFEVATVRPTTDDSQNEHCQDHCKVIHNYNCLSTVSGLNQLLCRRALWCRLGRSQTVFYSRLFAFIAMFLRLK